MTVTLDAVGGFTQGSGGSITSLSGNQTTSAGDSVLVAVTHVPSTGAPTISATCGGTSMTLLGTEDYSTGATEIVVKLFKIDGVSAGTPSVVVTASAATYMAAQSISLSGVGSWGTVQTTSTTGTSISQTTTGYATGDLVIQSFASRGWNGSSTNGGFTGFSGGTNQYYGGFAPGAYVSPDLSISTATANTTFSATIGGSDYMVGIAVVAGPVTGTTVTPTTATVGISGGTPTVITGSNYTASPTTATVTITGGTSNVGGNVTATPATATITITGSTPGVAQSYGPLARVINALTLGGSTVIQAIGDSTCYGEWDTGFSSGTSPWTPGTLDGWPGRLALALGEYYNANVVLYALSNYPGSGTIAGPTTLYSAGGGRPTITLYNLGWPGATFSTYSGSPASFFPAISPDVVITNTGFNENSGNVSTNYASLVSTIQSDYPKVPVVVTTQNATTITQESGHSYTFAQIFSAVVQAFIPSGSLPLSPALQASTNTTGVWVLDTQQAGQNASTLYTDGLHPIAPGYAEQAQFMLNQLTTGLPGLIQDAGLFLPTTATVAITGGTSNVLVPYVASPTTATVTITTGTPVITTNSSYTASPTTATVAITGGTSTVLAPVVATPTTATVHVTGGTSSITVLYLIVPTTSSVAISGGTSLITGYTYLAAPTSASVHVTAGTSSVVVSGIVFSTPAQRITHPPANVRTVQVVPKVRVVQVPDDA